MKFTGHVSGGKLKLDTPAAWPIALREYDGKRVSIEIEPEKVRRSVRQNARHWTVLVPLAQHLLNLKRGSEMLPLSREQVHYLLVAAFGACEETELGPVPVRSREMTTKQFHELDEKIALWLADNKYPIPDGEDAGELVEAATL